jgi:predicted nucleotidyltransferase
MDRNIIIGKLADALQPLDFIHALWLEGADATNTADEYSDIDFWVVFEDAHEEEAVSAVEAALSSLAEIDYKYVMRHNHPKIRQRIYHLAGTSEYLMIDFCWQLHSRPRSEYSYQKDDPIETAKVLFDKSDVIEFKPVDLAQYSELNADRLEEAKYRRTQFLRAEKYVKRGLYLEAFAYYNRYVVEPLVDLLRLIYTPKYANWYMVHISSHLPKAEKERLEYFVQISSLDDIAKRIPQAGKWFDELVRIAEENII